MLFFCTQDGTQMIEADVLLRGRDPKEPIMAHPPNNDSDITLQDWLEMVAKSDKGIKLDFKRLDITAVNIVGCKQYPSPRGILMYI